MYKFFIVTPFNLQIAIDFSIIIIAKSVPKVIYKRMCAKS